MVDERTIPLNKLKIEANKRNNHLEQHEREDLDYRSLFDQTGECVFIIGLDLRYIAVNHQALELLGYTEHELVGRSVSEIMSLEDELSDVSFVGDNSKLYERVLKRKDGSKLPVEISTSIVYNEKKEPAYIQSIARDISERKIADQALKQQASILSVISDATARLLQRSNIEERIPEVLESLGRAMNVYGCAIFEVNTFAATPEIEIQYQWNKQDLSALEISHIVQPFLPEILNLSGSYFSNIRGEEDESASPELCVAIMPIHGTLGARGFLGLFGQQKDVSWIPSEREAIQTAANLIGAALQRNRYEETIRLSEARNRIIIDALPDLLIRVDLDGNILDYSASPSHPLYVHRDIMTGRKLSQLWPIEITEKIIGASNRQAFTSTHWMDGIRLPHSNNIYESRLFPISSSEALVVIRDITEQEQLNQAKSDFINLASHELRTPLTTSILMVELLQQGGSSEEMKEYWQILTSELNRQKVLIDRLLMAGRLESGMMILERVPIRLHSVLHESLMAVKPIADKRGVSIQLSPEESSVIILGDRGGLQQVFINLINNAVKFSPKEGTVKVEVTANEDEAFIRIVDQGMGIPADAMAHLFERFYRAKNITVAEIPGSGIGLFIVKSILEDLGGTISVNSELNKGTTFTVSLKCMKPEI